MHACAHTGMSSCLDEPSSADSIHAPPGYRESFLALFILTLLFVCFGFGLFLRVRRRSGRLAKRSFSLLFLSGMALILSSLVVFFREYFGREKFNCTALLALHYLVMPLAVGPLVVRVNVHAYRLRKSQIRAGLSLGGVNKEQERIAHTTRDDASAEDKWWWWESFASFLTLRGKKKTQGLGSSGNLLPSTTAAAVGAEDFDEFPHLVVEQHQNHIKRSLAGSGRRSLAAAAAFAPPRATSFTTGWSPRAHDAEAELPLKELVRNESAWFGLVMVGLLSLPFVLALSLRASLEDRYYDGCVGCDLEALDVYILLGLSSLLCVLFGVSLTRVWHSADPLFVLWEAKLCMLVFLLLGFLAFILYLIDPNGWESAYLFTWLAFEPLWCAVLFFLQSYAQVLATVWINRAVGQSRISLLQLLENVELRDMFDDHLASEFSIENLRFWDRAIHWKTLYHMMGEDEAKTRAREIYHIFIARDAAMELNLSSANHKALGLAFEEGQIPITVFDEALEESYKLMSDGLSRFVRTEAF